MEHHFNVKEAKKYGIEAAVLLNNLRFWINKNKANNKHFINGKYWTYNSSKAFAELFPYMTASKIARELRKLEEMGVIESANLSENKYDHTKWYCVSDLQNETFDCTNMNNRGFENEQSNIDTDINTDKKQDIEETPINDFELFYNKYHLLTGKPKENKQECLKYWKRLSSNEKLSAMQSLEKWAAAQKGKECQFIVKCYKYIEYKRWQDEIKSTAKAKQPVTPHNPHWDNYIHEAV